MMLAPVNFSSIEKVLKIFMMRNTTAVIKSEEVISFLRIKVKMGTNKLLSKAKY